MCTGIFTSKCPFFRECVKDKVKKTKHFVCSYAALPVKAEFNAMLRMLSNAKNTE